MGENAVFEQILRMSFDGAVATGCVLLARLILRKAPKGFSYALWAVVIFRLLCPVAVTSQYSAMGLLRLPVDWGGEVLTSVPGETVAVPLPQESMPVIEAVPTVPQEIKPVPQVPVSTGWEFSAMGLAQILWLVGMAGMIVYSVVSYLRLHRRLMGAVHLEENVWLADGIPTPFVLGLLRTRIYLPSNLNSREEEYILLHERCHIRRLDHVVKALFYLALCIHWFNPVVWLAFLLCSRDMEMSCDEAVVRCLGSDIRAEYSVSVLRFAMGRPGVGLTPLAFGEGDAKGRILNMKNWKKPKLWICLAAALLCVAAVVVLCTDPKEERKGYPGAVEVQLREGESMDLPGYWYARLVCKDGRYWVEEHGEYIQPFAHDWVTGVVLADISGDGLPEICGQSVNMLLSFAPNGYVQIYDHAQGSRMILGDDGYSYTMYIENGKLRFMQFGMGCCVSGGQLVYDYDITNGYTPQLAEDTVYRLGAWDALQPGSYRSLPRWYTRDASVPEKNYLYEVGYDDTFRITNAATGEIQLFRDIRWRWEELPWTDEQWQQMCPFGGALRQTFGRVQYQSINEEYCILRLDSNLWLVKLQNRQVESIYNMVSASWKEKTAWLQTDSQKSLRVELDLPYTRVEAKCTGGSLVREGDSGQSGKNVGYSADQNILWSPWEKTGELASPVDLTLTVYNDGEVVGAVVLNLTVRKSETSIGYSVGTFSPTLRVVPNPIGDGVILQIDPLKN